MSYKKLRLFPRSTPGTFRVSFGRPAQDDPAERGRSWSIYDPELDEARRINADVMLGMALVFTISANFWMGLGLAVAQLVR